MDDVKENSLETALEVVEFMERNMAITMFRGEEQIFLPKPSFDIVTSEIVVRNLVSTDEGLVFEHQEREDFIQKVVLHGSKMFATCIFSEMSLACVKNLFDSGLTDEQFPFKISDCLAFTKAGSPPDFISRRKTRSTFVPNQKLFNTAFFSLDSELFLDDRVAKPIDFDESMKYLLGSGSSGLVYKIHIHPSQHSLPVVGSYEVSKGSISNVRVRDGATTIPLQWWCAELTSATAPYIVLLLKKACLLMNSS